MNLTLGSKGQQTTRYKGGLLVREIINGRSGVATQTKNEPKCPGAKGADETINKMTKDRSMKRSNDARKSWPLDRLMKGGKDEMIEMINDEEMLLKGCHPDPQSLRLSCLPTAS